MAPETQPGTPAPDAPGSVGTDTDRIVAEICVISQAIKDLDAALKEKAEPFMEQLKALQDEMAADLGELQAQADNMQKDLAARKQQLIEHWPTHTGRIVMQGWTIDRKERKGVDILSEEILMTRVLARVAWDKLPVKFSWNHTKLAKLVENGVVEETIARPTVTVSIAVTPPRGE